MKAFHSSRTVWRSEWQTPQNRISIWTSLSPGSRRSIVVAARGEVLLAAEKALALVMPSSWLGALDGSLLDPAQRDVRIARRTSGVVHPIVRISCLILRDREGSHAWPPGRSRSSPRA